MSRWRPPAEASTAIITRAGYERLRAEFNDLWRVRRPEVVRALSEAAAEGDRSENAEYIYRKKQLGEIDRRVRYLGKRLESLKVAEDRPSDPRAIYFGARFELVNADNGELVRYRIVGPDEIDPKLGHISIDSPLARAVLRRRVDDEFEVELPAGKTGFVVVSVDYDPAD
jgi:transcription elongation factor GreB